MSNFPTVRMRRTRQNEQLFTRSKLEELGHWCLAQLGAGQFTCEDCAGGLLLIDKAI